jgi:hypothetical protein
MYGQTLNSPMSSAKGGFAGARVFKDPRKSGIVGGKGTSTCPSRCR